MRISEDLIKEIIDKVNIIDVVSSYVKLEKKGTSFFGVCPFHQDTSPSMSVNNDKKIYKCFSCGSTGNVISFVMNYENIPYPQAVKRVANIAGVEVNIELNDKNEEKNGKFYDITNIAKDFYKFYLHDTKNGLIALEYLNNRGLSQETIDRFEIGLSSEKYDYLYETLLDNGKDVSDIMECGLLKLGKSYYDLFRSRIMFPLHDEFGHVVGFSGRIYQESQVDQPKYVNSPESRIFKKSEILYNLDKAKNVIKRKDRVMLYEGFMDVISVVNAGLEESVATMGTSLSEHHIKTLRKFTNNIVLCFDGDKAGLDATNKTIELLKKTDFNIKVVMLPEGLDPDEYIRKYGSERYIHFVESSTIDVIEFKYRYLKSHVNFKSYLDIEKFKVDVFALLSTYNSSSLMELYFKKLSLDLEVSITAIQSDYKNYLSRKTVKKEEPVKVQQPNKTYVKFEQVAPVVSKPIVKPSIPIRNKYQKAEITLTRYMLTDKETAYYINKKLNSFYVDNINALIRYKIVDYYDRYEVSQIDIENFIEHLSDEQRMTFESNIMEVYKDINKQEVDDCIKVVIEFNIETRIKELKERINSDIPDEQKLQIAAEILSIQRNRANIVR